MEMLYKSYTVTSRTGLLEFLNTLPGYHLLSILISRVFCRLLLSLPFLIAKAMTLK